MKLELLKESEYKGTVAKFFLKNDEDGDITVGAVIAGKSIDIAFFTARSGSIKQKRYVLDLNDRQHFHLEGNLIESK